MRTSHSTSLYKVLTKAQRTCFCKILTAPHPLHQPFWERSHHLTPFSNPWRKFPLPGRHRSYQQNREANLLKWLPGQQCLKWFHSGHERSAQTQLATWARLLQWGQKGQEKHQIYCKLLSSGLKKFVWVDECFSMCSHFAWKLETPKRWSILGFISRGIYFLFMGQVFASRLKRHKLWYVDISHSHFLEAQEQGTHSGGKKRRLIPSQDHPSSSAGPHWPSDHPGHANHLFAIWSWWTQQQKADSLV